MRSYNAQKNVQATNRPLRVAGGLPGEISPSTKLVSIDTASELLRLEKGLSLSPWTLRQYCNSGKWGQGVFWVKRGRSYLVNMEAVYHWVVYG
jgi:hypothetical protein